MPGKYQNPWPSPIAAVAKASFPFFVLRIIATVLVTTFPQIVLSLPQAMTAR